MKKMLLLIVCMGFMLPYINAQAKVIELSSPNGKLNLSLQISDKIAYSIKVQDKVLLDNCLLQIQLRDQTLGENPKIVSQKRKTITETIKPVVPLKYSSINNQYNQLIINFKGNYAVEFRAFDGGIAYRFISRMKDDIEVIGENFSISFPENYSAYTQQPNGFKTSYEDPYTKVETNLWKQSDKMSTLPVLINTSTGYKILISETDLTDYPGMFLKGSGENGMYAVFPKAPLKFGEDGDRSLKILEEADYIAKTSGDRSFPWRYFIIAENDAKLVESTLPVQLAPASNIVDPSWIKPGQVSWEWWNDASPYGDDVNFVSGYNLETYKYYIDFAAKQGIPYILMDEGWAKSTRDPYTPNPRVNVHELIRYGKEKNVGVILWLTWLTVENNFDLFETFKKWGVAGVKIDFMDRSDQWMVNYYERVAKEAAKNELLIDFHGSFKPSGLEQRYPNVLSYEGVRGMEQMGGATPNNSLLFPFIRNIAGPMDYTPGAMISMQPEVYSSRRPNSASIGTRAYQLALYVVFESGIQMLADNPTMYYRNQDCTDFITKVPTTWDETKVLEAKVGEYIVVAKRKGEKWFIGAITNGKESERTFTLNMDFLKVGKTYDMISFEDGINAGRQAMDYRKKISRITLKDPLQIKLVKNGGWAAILQ
ncbi:MAG: glycoside hydrolase family 97 protein [Dysgonamonadaceae bacterium]|nr:glycoside hydrolase family 97 protein [Dysgonamonadaceae bacterium]